MPDDVFGEIKPGENVNPLDNLVGEGKKFKTVEDLAKGKVAADEHISNLEKELDAMRKQLNPQFDAEKQLTELRAEIQALRTNPPQGRSGEPTASSLTVEGITALVNETITRAERNQTISQNITQANNAVVEHFGNLDAAAAAVKEKAAELGMSIEDLKGIAAKSPTAFQKIVLGAAGKAGEGPLNPQSTITKQPDAPRMGDPKPGTKEYFDTIFKTDRKKYFTPEIQMQLHKAAKDGTYQL